MKATRSQLGGALALGLLGVVGVGAWWMRDDSSGSSSGSSGSSSGDDITFQPSSPIYDTSSSLGGAVMDGFLNLFTFGGWGAV